MHNIPPEIARTSGALWIVIGSAKKRRRRKERKQKRRCRSGLLARLKRQPFKPSLPSIFLTNARSVVKKIEELNLLLAAQPIARDCCVLVVTEIWLRKGIPDTSVWLAGHTMHRSDRKATAAKAEEEVCAFTHITTGALTLRSSPQSAHRGNVCHVQTFLFAQRTACSANNSSLHTTRR